MTLLDSYIIPKLVYKRIGEYPNSRFRNVSVEGYIRTEKKALLCEEFFNGYETPCVNTILDAYFKDKKTKNVNNDIVNNYIFTM